MNDDREALESPTIDDMEGVTPRVESIRSRGRRFSPEDREKIRARVKELVESGEVVRSIVRTLKMEKFVKPDGTDIDESFVYGMKSRLRRTEDGTGRDGTGRDGTKLLKTNRKPSPKAPTIGLSL